MHIPSAFAENQRRMKAAAQKQEAPAKGISGLFKSTTKPVDIQEQQALQHQQFIQVLQQRQAAAPQAQPAASDQPSAENTKSAGIWGWFGKKEN
jgi:hypothetical protein